MSVSFLKDGGWQAIPTQTCNAPCGTSNYLSTWICNNPPKSATGQDCTQNLPNSPTYSIVNNISVATLQTNVTCTAGPPCTRMGE